MRRKTLEYNVKSSTWSNIKFICHFNIKLEFTTKTIALTIVCLRLVQGTWEREKILSNATKLHTNRMIFLQRLQDSTNIPYLLKISWGNIRSWKLIHANLMSYEIWFFNDDNRRQASQVQSRQHISDVAVLWCMRHHISNRFEFVFQVTKGKRKTNWMKKVLLNWNELKILNKAKRI